MKSRFIMDNPGFLKGNKRSWFPIITIILFMMLVGLAVVRIFYQVRSSSEDVIIEQLPQLAEIFTLIDKETRIANFDNQKTPIDFLNVVKFAGSEIGQMNLTYADKWMGPFMKDNPTVQGKEYQIVRTKKGYFIVPGDGVVLSNGKVIGKDIVLDEKADIQAMMKDNGALNFKGKPLAVKLDLSIGKSMLQQVLFENDNYEID